MIHECAPAWPADPDPAGGAALVQCAFAVDAGAAPAAPNTAPAPPPAA
eukprot:gene37757-26917_t